MSPHVPYAPERYRSSNGKGLAARVLAILLNEADRIDGMTPRVRLDFNGTQWNKWVRDYKRYEQYFKESHEAGIIPPAVLALWARG